MRKKQHKNRGAREEALRRMRETVKEGQRRRAAINRDGDLYRVSGLLAEGRISAAREAFKEEFGVSHKDREVIDFLIEDYFHQADSSEPPKLFVELPHYLVLAVMLREGFAGRGRGKDNEIGFKVMRKRVLIESCYKKERARLRAEKEKPNEATAGAIEHAWRQYGEWYAEWLKTTQAKWYEEKYGGPKGQGAEAIEDFMGDAREAFETELKNRLGIKESKDSRGR